MYSRFAAVSLSSEGVALIRFDAGVGVEVDVDDNVDIDEEGGGG